MNAKYNDNSITEANKEKKRDVVTLDKKHVTLNGIPSGTGPNGVTSKVIKAYANDQTIFLSAKTDLITADKASQGNDKKTVIISGVSNISTGIRNTSLTAYSAQGVLGENNSTTTRPTSR